nr:DUF4202 family protein [uncultured Cohaesibacter sp.]
MTALNDVLESIDHVNAEDPLMSGTEGSASVPASLLFGLRMDLVCDAFAPSADDHVKIAARGQLLESWKFEPNDEQQETVDRAEVDKKAKHHCAQKLSQIMLANGYEESDCEIVRDLILGQTDADDGRAQLLKDLNGLVYLRFYSEQASRIYSQEKLSAVLAEKLSSMTDDALFHAIDHIDDPRLIDVIQSVRNGLSLQKRSITYID